MSPPLADQAPGRHAWVDPSAGVAGDMLLAALLDAGADLTAIRQAVRAVAGEGVSLEPVEVTRAGLRAVRVRVEVDVADPPHRPWPVVRGLLSAADLDPVVRDAALGVFARLATAEGRVHGIDPERVEFHEVGALDAIADVVGVCTALSSLDVVSVGAGPVALGSGTVRGAHGELPVPVPAVAELASGWPVTGGGPGERATPTGMALLATLAVPQPVLPGLRLDRVGVGAGTRDTPGRANVVRVLLGEPTGPAPATDRLSVLEANVDDLDPRLWPEVLAALLRAGAADAWLVPIVMKKGRPAHTLTVLGPEAATATLRTVILTETSTAGVRIRAVERYALPRTWVQVPVDGHRVRVKVSHSDGVVVQATPEFDDVAAVAAATGTPAVVTLRRAESAAVTRGLVPGQPWGDGATTSSTAIEGRGC